MVGVTKIGRGNAKYWIEAVAEGGEDYYTRPGERPGIWMGRLAAELGLDGEVDRDAYFALLAGQHPISGETLVRRPAPRVFVDASGRTRRKEPILGYDIRIAAPKSVSLLWAIGSPEVQAAVEEALEDAVRQSLSYLERNAVYVQRGKGGAVIEDGSGLISMGFLHRSSRAGDPSLHFHVVSANMTRAASDGRWLSIANPRRQSPLFTEGKASGYIFQAALRAGITRRLGAEWEPITNGYSDVAGIPRAAIDHFSRRRGEIVAELAERGTSSPAAAVAAAYRTREGKDYGVDPDRQRQDWRSRAAEFGLGETAITRITQRRRAREPEALSPTHIDAAIGILETTHSHFDRRDLLCALAEQMRDGADVDHLTRTVDDVLKSPRVVEIHHDDGPLGTSYFTTPRLLELETVVLRSARSGANAGVAIVDEQTLSSVLSNHAYLSAEQVQMVRRITTGGERIVVVAARPGTGKTTALRAAREAWGEANIRGIGVATARSASGELADAGVPSMSIAALRIRCDEARYRGRRPLPTGIVILVDESSTTSTEDMAALVELVELCDGKLVLIGDERQIGSVGAGGLYGRLASVTEPVRLTEIRRQRDPHDRRIVEMAHEGRGSDALDLLRARERLLIADTLDAALDALSLDWHRALVDGDDAVMIARRIRDVEDLNVRARELLRADGRLAGPRVEVGGREFAVGDRVITRINNREVSNRERWEVIGVDRTETHLMLRRIGGDKRTVVASPRYLQRRTDSNEPAIQHAYALTTYATESKTFDSAFALLDANISREDFVVAVSRARGPTTAYAVAASELLDPDLGPARRELDDEAHDVRIGAERVAAEFSADEVPDRNRIAATPEHELAARCVELRAKSTSGIKSLDDAGRNERMAAIERRIEEAVARLEVFTTDDSQARNRPPKTIADSAERRTRVQLARLEVERRSLKSQAEAPATPAHSTLSAAERAELALVEDRLLFLRRARVRAERIEPSQLIVDALGPRPKDAMRAAMWNEGVDTIVGYRQLYGINNDRHPLGPPAVDAQQRRARREAEDKLRAVQRAIHRDQVRSKEIVAEAIR
ncbi:MAG: relaxase domain-containing protein [Actinobacteria bacterium]|nr:relaxase domain-containing protein [Actinomycetota bacterium]